MRTFDWDDFLTHHRLFSSFDKREITWLLREDVSQERMYQKDEVLFSEGEGGDTLFLIGSGSVQIILPGKTAYDMALTTLRKGEFFGEMAMIEQRPRAAMVKAVEDCTVLEVKGQEFRELLADHTDIAFKMLLELSERMRRVNRILAEKVQDVDAKLEIFRAELRAELTVVEAELKAAQAVFEQTKVRTDEVISSAERSRTRMTMMVTLIGAIVTGLGWFGFQELLNLRQQATHLVEQLVEDARKETATGKQLVEDARKEAATGKQLVEDAKQETAKAKLWTEETRQSAGEATRLIGQSRQLLAKSKEKVVQHVLYPALRDAVVEGKQEDAGPLYNDMKELQSLDESALAQLLDLIEDQMINEQKTLLNYTALLTSIRNDVYKPENKIRAYYLFLANAIFVNTDEYEKTLSGFKDYIARDTAVPMHRETLRKIENFFSMQPQDKRVLFDRVRQLIRTK